MLKAILGADAAIGIVTTVSLAIGVAAISWHRRFTRNFEAALFRNVLGIAMAELWMITGVTLASSLGIFLLYRPFLLAAVLIVAVQVMKVTLIAAALIIPPSAARLLTDRFSRLLGLATVLGIAMGVVGMFARYHLDMASGATIVLVGTGIFAIVWLFSADTWKHRGFSTSSPDR